MEKFESTASPESEKYFRRELTLDDKSRVVLPAAFRKQFDESGSGIIMTLNMTDEKPGYLLWPKDDFRDFVERLFSLTRFEKAEHRKIRSYFSGNSYDANPDEQGRVHLPTVYGPYGELEFVWEPGENYAVIAPQDVEKTDDDFLPKWFKEYCRPDAQDYRDLAQPASDIEDDGEIST
jgi:DNA-binding transcriptional regulator/RsmH inhibitor MraZ